MFSANENIALRQHKRRIVKYVEECIPQQALDAGTSVMVMQVSCKEPGCVPLETAIIICFPRPFPPPSPDDNALETKELIPGIEGSKNGGNFKSKVLLPLSEVTKEDVLEALPPSFIGGKRTKEKIRFRVRDFTFGQISQVLEDSDKEGRKSIAKYLIGSLEEYVERDCIAPPVGEEYQPLNVKSLQSESMKNTVGFNEGKNVLKSESFSKLSKKERNAKLDIFNHSIGSSRSTIQKLAEREHGNGTRIDGCPCCDPDEITNVLDGMITMM